MTSSDLAEILGVSPRTVETWRSTCEGPDYVKIGQQVRYDPVDVQAWLDTIRTVQGNTEGRRRPGPSWRDFVDRCLVESDAWIPPTQVWLAWLQYVDRNGPGSHYGGPEQFSDLGYSLKKHITTVHAGVLSPPPGPQSLPPITRTKVFRPLRFSALGLDLAKAHPASLDDGPPPPAPWLAAL